MRTYQVLLYQERFLGSLIFGASKVHPERFAEALNEQARKGWRVVSLEKDERRMLLFWRREAYLVVMEREE